jgi:fatty acid desaturase
MEDIISSSQRVPRDALRGLMGRSDGPALARILASLAVFSGSVVATGSLAAADDPLWLAPTIVGGLAYATFFPPLHEAGHGTAFASPALNTATTWLCAILMLEGPSFFREFHWEHHRHTQDRRQDPEIMAAPDLLDGWPSNIVTYLALASGQLLWIGKLMFTVGSALLPAALRRHFFPYVRATQAARVARECRLVLAILVAAIALGLAFIPGFWAILLIWPIGHVFLGLYLMPEHTGLGHEGSQLHRTRTIHSNALLRWWMWNMPYHGEHHAYPGVPFHALPRLHRLLGDEVEHPISGYLAFHAEAIRRALGLRP